MARTWSRLSFSCPNPYTAALNLSIYKLQEPPVFLAHLPRLLKGTGPLVIKATKVTLNVPDVELKVIPDDVTIVPCGLRVGRYKGPRRREAGFRFSGARHRNKQKYN